MWIDAQRRAQGSCSFIKSPRLTQRPGQPRMKERIERIERDGLVEGGQRFFCANRIKEGEGEVVM